MGAWIEILMMFPKDHSLGVAPLVGAWIEIQNIAEKNMAKGVAPLVGAWIEIISDAVRGFGIASLLSWERGLKYVKGGLY